MSQAVRAQTLVDLLLQRSQRSPDRLAFRYLTDGEANEVCLSHGQLDHAARAIGARLQAEAPRGSRCALLYPPGLEFIAAFFGCLYGGLVPVPLSAPRPTGPVTRLLGILGDAAPALVVTTTAFFGRMAPLLARAPELAEQSFVLTDEPDVGDAGAWRHPGLDGQDLALLQYTSGSTSEPKGVMVTHANLLANARMIQRAIRIDEDSVLLSWLPTFHDMGLVGKVIQPVYSGAACTHLSPTAFAQRPIRWLRAITRFHATISGGPNFAYQHCVRTVAAQDLEALDLRSWAVAFNGSEPIAASTLREFAATFEPAGFRPEAFFPCYGLAEATLFVSGGPPLQPVKRQTVASAALVRHRIQPPGDPDEKVQTLVGCGEGAAGQTIVFVNPDTLTECEPGELGEIWLAGPHVTQGYWRHEAATHAAFGMLPGRTQHFLRTGDLGCLRDGQLFVTGRLKDLIILQGKNYYPQDVERSVDPCHPAIRAGCGAAFTVDVEGGERLVLVQEVDSRGSTLDGVAPAIRRAVYADHELPVHYVVLVKPGAVPRTSSGKVERQACRSTFLCEEIEALYRDGLT